VSVRVAGGNVRLVQLECKIQKIPWNLLRAAQFSQQVSNRVSPSLDPKLLEDSLYGLLGGLLSREARPVKEAPDQVVGSVFQVTSRLLHLISASLHARSRVLSEAFDIWSVREQDGSAVR